MQYLKSFAAIELIVLRKDNEIFFKIVQLLQLTLPNKNITLE